MRKLLPLLFAAASCSLVVPADQTQCTVDADCAERGFVDAICEQSICVEEPVDPVWGCLGSVPEPVMVPGATHMVAQRFTDALTGATPEAIRVKLCSSIDLSCETPIEADVQVVEGLATVTVPSGFRGYFDVMAEGVVPALVPVGPVVEDEIDITEPVQLVSLPVIQALAGAAGLSVDETKGNVLMLLTGCDRTGRAGVSFTADPIGEGESFYFYDLAPDTEATESAESGNGGVLNLDPGFVTLTTTRAATGEFISQNRVLIREGSTTYVPMLPTASP